MNRGHEDTADDLLIVCLHIVNSHDDTITAPVVLRIAPYTVQRAGTRDEESVTLFQGRVIHRLVIHRVHAELKLSDSYARTA
jgi:hypothetical protein